jgi:nucleotide-binding universal stress UspA family protein
VDEQAANDGMDAAIGIALEAENAEVMRRAGKVTQAAAEGHPKDALLDAVTDSDLLVVGCGGHTDPSGGHLGSTSRHVVAHSPCPVVVVPEPRRHPGSPMFPRP